jgi:hypothetical protein
MKKRLIFLLFGVIALIIIPSVISIYEELIYSETVEDGDAVTIDGKEFGFKIDSKSNKVFIEIDVSGVIVEGGSCTIKDKYDICISNINFSYRNYDPWYDVYKADVDVYKIKPKLEILNTLEKTDLLINEEVGVSLTIENTADVVAENIATTVKIPKSIEVADVVGCSKTEEGVRFDVSVFPRQTRICTYKIRGIFGGDYEIETVANYFDGTENISLEADDLEIKVYNYSLNIISKLNKSVFDVGEKLNFTLGLENTNEDYDVQVTTFTVKIPNNLILVKGAKNFVGSGKLLGWSGTLAPGDNETFIFEFQGTRTGNYSVITEAKYRVGKFLRSSKKTTNIEIRCDCPAVVHEFSQGIAVPGQRIGMTADLVNPSLKKLFRNVKVGYATNIPELQDFSRGYAEIKPGETIKIFDSTIITPGLDEVYHFNISAVYESLDNQIFVAKDNIRIKIPNEEGEAVESAAVIEEEIDVEEPDPSENIPEDVENDSEDVDDEVADGAELNSGGELFEGKENISKGKEGRQDVQKWYTTFLKPAQKSNETASFLERLNFLTRGEDVNLRGGFMLTVYILAVIILIPVCIHIKRRWAAKKLNKKKKENENIPGGLT